MPINDTVGMTGPVAPKETTDTYPSHIDIYGKGGFAVVDDEAAMLAIPELRRTIGMWRKFGSTVYELTTNPAGDTTSLTDWTEVTFGGISGDTTLVGTFTPVAGTEYPSTTGVTDGVWAITGVTGTYIYTSGDLSGYSVRDGNGIVFDGTNWTIIEDYQQVNVLNIYNTDGMLTSNRSVNMFGRTMKFKNGNVAIGDITPNNLLQVHNLLQFHPTNYSVHLGQDAGVSNTGSENVFTGYQAGYNNTTGTNNVFSGYQAGSNNITGHYNVANGALAGGSLTTGHYNVFLGAYSGGNGTITGTGNMAIGYRTMQILTSGADNVAIGNTALNKVTSGRDNTAIGSNSLVNIGLGAKNIAIGAKSGYTATGNLNMFLGYMAGYYETGSNRLYIANSNTTTPLIYGEFDNNKITLNVDNFNLSNIPTVITGLVSGDVWNDSGTLKIV